MEVDLRLIQNKICHPVEEIRTRTINSLLYKLDQNLVDPAVLVNECQLFKSLLKSLEFGGPSVNQVLSVLDLLSTEKQGISTLGDVGAINSLNRYKASSGESNELVDKLIDKILSLPCKESDPKDDINSTPATTITTLSNTSHETAAAASNTVENTTSFNSTASSNPDVTTVTSGNIVFPLIRLNDNDSRILKNVEERLLDEALFAQSCDFFKDVLLSDYPTEVFLQNTGIVLNILKLLRDSNTLSPVVTREQHAIAALARMFEGLDVRISLLSKCWVSNPKWSKSETDLNGTSTSTSTITSASDKPVLSLPKLLFVALKCVLPVYKRCDNEASAKHLTAFFLKLTKFLSTLNSAPFTFNVNTTQLQHTFGLLGESVRCVYRKWNKTSIMSTLTPTLLASLIAFSTSFFEHFIPSDKYSDFLPTTLLDVFRDLYFNQTFFLSHQATYHLIEKVLEVTTPDLVAQRARVNMILEMISIATGSSVPGSISPLQVQNLYDGLEGTVHFKDDNLIQQVVECLLENMAVELETCTNSLVWMLSNKTINKTVYTLLNQITRKRFIFFHPDVLWEISVHGLTSPPDVELPATQLLSNLLTTVPHEAPTTQHRFYRALHDSLFFLVAALTHVPELRDTLRQYLTDNARFMTEVESVKMWVAMLFSRCEVVREWPLLELAKWAASQGVGLKLSGSCLVVPESSKTVLSISMTTGNLDIDSIEKLKLIAFNSSLSEDLRVAALQQLAVLLSDASIHGSFATLPNTLLGMLCDVDVSSELVLPIVRCLRHLVHHNPATRETLAANTELYASLLRLIGEREAVEAGFETDREVKAEVGTILLLLVSHDFSSPTFWSRRSYYDLYNVILPDCIPLSLHLPTHLTTLPPTRPLPPPVVPSVWLSWLQTHYHVQCGGGVARFLDRQSEVPGVESIREVLKVSHIPTQLSDASHVYLEIVSALCILSGDKILSGLIQEEITRRCSDTPDVLPLLMFYTSYIPTNVIGYFISKLEETTDSVDSLSTTRQILELYSEHRQLQEQCGSRLFGPLLRLYKSSQDKITVSQLVAKCLPIASHKLDVTPKERKELIKTLTRQIETLSHGRGDCESYMAAHVLRYLFCCLVNVNTVESRTIRIRWIVPWITDKDPVIRSAAFSLEFQTPDSPLTTESGVVLAISAFVDNAEVYTVRHQALCFIDRVLRAVTSNSDEQTMALCVLALKRMALYDSCTAFARELNQLVLYKEEEVHGSQMITSYFEEHSESGDPWNPNYVGLFYILDGMLQLNITLGKCDVVVLKDNRDLLVPLYPLFNADMLKSILMFDTSSLEVYVACFCKLLALTDSALCDIDFLLNVMRVLEIDCQTQLVIHLKSHCLSFMKHLIGEGALDDYWSKLLPLTSKFLAFQPLQQASLQILSAGLSHKNRAVFVDLLQKNAELSSTLCAVIFDIFSKFKITSLGPYDMFVFSVTGMLCQQVECCRNNAISQGIVEICYEYMLLLSQHMGALALASGKENTGNARVTKTKSGKVVDIEDQHLLKSLSCVLYCLCCCVGGCTSAATRLTDLDIITTLDGMWVYYCSNIVVLNYVVKLLSLLAKALPSSVKMLITNKSLLSHLLDAALKSVRFSKHPITPLRHVFFDFLCVVASNEDAIRHIWKSGFMSNFPKLDKQKAEPEKLGLWLKLVTHGTYTPFGQKMVLTIPQILDILLESPHKYNVLLLVRNLVFNVKSHPKLLTHSSLIDYVLSSVVSERPKQTVVALQVILYFIRFSSKAKTIFRNKGAGQVLGKLDLQMKNDPNGEMLAVLEPLLSVYS